MDDKTKALLLFAAVTVFVLLCAGFVISVLFRVSD